MTGGRVDLVLFDCDGVLVDSEQIALAVDAVVLAEMGWRLSEAEIAERFLGRSADAMREALEEHLGRALPPDWDAPFDERYRTAFADGLKPVDGILEALDAIDLPTCVASSGSHAKMRFTLGLTGLYDRFAGRIFSAEDVARAKPAPDLFLHAARTLGADPARCVVVEDSPSGVEAARAAGMRALGYAGGLVPPARLEAAGADVFADMRGLPSLLSRAGR